MAFTALLYGCAASNNDLVDGLQAQGKRQGPLSLAQPPEP